MEPVNMIGADGNNVGQTVDPLPFARSYQIEALEKAIKQNTIVFLETGSGKTLIAIMLLRYYAHLLRKPSPFIAVFLVPKVVLVPQQAEAVKMHTDLKVGTYWGDMGVDFWDAATWRKEQDKHEVLVMTPAILLNGLRHSFFKLDMIKVLIFDECHHARGKDPYACIMKMGSQLDGDILVEIISTTYANLMPCLISSGTSYYAVVRLIDRCYYAFYFSVRLYYVLSNIERLKRSNDEFYHGQVRSNNSNLPRIFGMTASPIKTKGTTSTWSCGKNMIELENLMNSKIYTSVSEAVLAEFVPFSTPKLTYYKDKDIPSALFESLAHQLEILKNKAAEFSFCDDMDICCWGQLDLSGEEIIKNFNKDAYKVISTYLPSGTSNPELVLFQYRELSVGDDLEADAESGFLTTKVICLVGSLLQYRHLKNLRCIVFVERVITAIVLQKLLSKLLPKLSGWEAGYIAGNASQLQSQSRRVQNALVEEFRKGMVNVIVSTSILEEGLDVQSCNLVIRFDPSATVCSFIQSRGRARMQNSDYLLMVRSGDDKTLSRLRTYLDSGKVMREESLRNASLPCAPLKSSLDDEEFYWVESTRAIVTLSSSIGLLYFYCSRLPSDGYFKPTPRCSINQDMGTCTIYLPKSCPIQTVSVRGNIKTLKQIACLEACKELHKAGALTDNLVPQIVEEEAIVAQDENIPYDDEQATYYPPELINPSLKDPVTPYHCYLIELNQKYEYEVSPQGIVLAVRSELEYDVGNVNFDLQVDRGTMTVSMNYVGVIHLTAEQVLMCRKFQITLLRVLIDRAIDKGVFDRYDLGNDQMVDYLMLPSTNSREIPSIIDWKCLGSVFFSHENASNHMGCFFPRMHTKSGFVCSCTLKNSIVYTPHTSQFYCITGILGELNGNSFLSLKNGGLLTYKEYYHLRHGIELQFDGEKLLKGRRMFVVQNYLQRCRQQKEKELSNTTVELPPELCVIFMSPISISIIYSFSLIPSIMHRIESLLLAVNLKNIHLNYCKQNDIPTFKVLEAITTKHCQEGFHLESLETLGDSFLKYAASQQLFKTFQNHHEGLLSVKKERIISNASLCKLGCDRKLPGFIRNESFDPKKWIIAGDQSRSHVFGEELLSSTRKIYVSERRKLKSKRIADVVEALIGAFLSTGGETAALIFMRWLGINVDFVKVPYKRDFPVILKRHVNVSYLESILNYSFRDPSLLVESLTHGSYMLPEIPRCYQRLEFLGDAVLDYLMTMHLYHKYPGMSPGLLTDLRSASVNNDCYAQSAVKAKLHQHILHSSQELHRHIVVTVGNFDKLPLESTFGWESESSFPKVLGDVIESLAGAILVDSDYNKEVVFQSIRPLLEPLITPETVKLHPARELDELCQKEHYEIKRVVVSQNGKASVTIEVEANGAKHKHTSTSDKRTAIKLASKEVLKSLKESIAQTGN
ncbi:Endoribonuclease Dicer-like 2 [Vitis vinifera]|uniref:Endoribonuclease Dicer-like 2 n=1 Tax=Vitis vinifera TaxID=29760 RepID=A0A438CVA9_VITVI|nr:Endoribonuclease Dicer-like 2 [Vitis vinifera]